MDFLENVAFLDYRVCLALKDKWALVGPWDQEVIKELGVILDWKDRLEWLEELVLQDPLESLEKRVKLVIPDFLDQRVVMGFLEAVVCLEFQVHKEILEKME